MTPLEKEIYNKIKQGDEKSFDILFKSYFPSLCRYAFDILNDKENSGEVVLDVFMKFWESRDSLTISTTIKGYLFRMVHNRCLNFIRDRKAENKPEIVSLDDRQYVSALINLETPPEIIEKLFSEHIESRLKQALDSLPPQCREIFILCRFANLSYPEVARKMNLSLSTVKTQMVRAITKLKVILDEEL